MTHRMPYSALSDAVAPLWAMLDLILLVLVMLACTGLLGHSRTLQSVVWLGCYGLTLMRVAMYFEYFMAVLIQNWVLFIFPVVCTASVLWSLDRGTSLAGGIQLIMTYLIATYLGWRYSLIAIVRVLLIILALAMVLSIIHWLTGIFPWPVFGASGGLTGVYTQKNFLGQQAMMCLLLIVMILLVPQVQVSGWFKFAAVCVMPFAATSLVLSVSIASILLTPIMIGLLLLLSVRWLPAGLTAVLAASTVVITALGPLALTVANIDPMALLFDTTGKSSTLTGRTELWALARNVSEDYPVLGVGYRAFWTVPQFVNERLMSLHAGATSPSFHNFLWEIRVGGGWPAVVAMIVFLIASFEKVRRLYNVNPSVPPAFAIVVVIAAVVVALLTPSLVRPHEFMIVLITMIAVSAQQQTRLMALNVPNRKKPGIMLV